MERQPLHFALREIRAHLTDRRVLAAMLVIALLLGLVGPFGTLETMSLVQRLAYWAAIVVSSYGLAYAVARMLSRSFGIGRRLRSSWSRILVFGAIAGLPVTVAVSAVDLVALGRLPTDLPMLYLQCTLIGLCVMAMLEIVDTSLGQAAAQPSPAPAPPGPPPIVERLPPPQRGRLVSLSVADHYVEVVTERGRGLVLIRLGDAIGETTGVPGLQIHRSHWVALSAIRRLVRTEGKPMLELADGRRLPVSRSYIEAVREAGFS
ncbi:LytTR family DNA-binding domain-containing protein [Devosia sp. A16]|uniref:LytTR family DNA-binding domain-containing protein n=1 Tax=Devosia sp. A16 TaxID=1736675 RepID=UPI0006D7D839|nr:LytTR family DNA-binding domain-containing protein [Devosia sp. A16]